MLGLHAKKHDAKLAKESPFSQSFSLFMKLELSKKACVSSQNYLGPSNVCCLFFLETKHKLIKLDNVTK